MQLITNLLDQQSKNIQRYKQAPRTRRPANALHFLLLSKQMNFQATNQFVSALEMSLAFQKFQPVLHMSSSEAKDYEKYIILLEFS